MGPVNETLTRDAPAPFRQDEFFTDGLDTSPKPGIGPILVTGASGYVGGRVVRELLHRGYRVRVLIRSDARTA
jgi:hypothetical protein